MKSFKLLIVLLLIDSISLMGQYYGNVQTNSNEIIYDSINSYDVLSFEDYSTTDQIGAPQLPVKILKYIIPIDVNVTTVTINYSNVQQLSGLFNIYPAQPPQIINGSSPLDFVEPDTSIYNYNAPYPGKLVEIIEDNITLGYHIVTLKFHPVEYIPLNMKINIYTDIYFTIEYETNPNSPRLPEKQTVKRYDLVKGFIKSSVENQNDFEIVNGGARNIIPEKSTTKGLKLNFLPTIEGDIPDYIIITNEELKPYFADFAKWEFKKGIPTIIVTTEQIDLNYNGCDLSEKIRNYLIDSYYSWGSGLFVLLGGDTKIIPERIGYHYTYSFGPRHFATDLYYATVQGNWNADGDNIFGESNDTIDTGPDHYLGRASVEDSTEAITFVNKVISYEKLNHPSIDQNYLKNALLMTGFLRKTDAGEAYDIQSEALTNILDLYIADNINGWLMFDDHEAIGNNTYPGDEELNRVNALEALNNGGSTYSYGNFHVIYHLDHSNPFSIGTSTKMKNQSIYRADVSTLTNSPYHHILFSGGCDPNDFQKDCFSEYYINNPNGGGVAFIGNTAHGWGGEWSAFQRFCDVIYNTAGHPSSGYNLAYAFQQSPGDADHRKRLNLLGDPEMPIWTNIPDTFAVSYFPDTVSNINNSLGITIGNLVDSIDVTVCLFKENEVYAYQTIFSDTSQEIFNFIISPNTPGDLDVTVTAHNYIPYEDTIPVDIVGSHLYVSGITIDDDTTGSSIGNGDLQADAGETVELSLSLTNSGDTVGYDVYAILSVDTNYSNYITINQDSSAFNNINPSDTLISLDNYIFTITADTPHIEQVKLNFEIYKAGSSHSDEYYLRIGIPELEQDNKLFITSDGDNIIESDDTVRLDVVLFNTGSAEVTGITATLQTSSNFVDKIIDSVQTYNNISPLASDTNLFPFVFVVSSVYSVGDTIDFTLRLTNEYGKLWTFPFNLNRPVDTLEVDFESGLTEIDLFWNPKFGIKGYNVYRCDDDNGNPAGNYEKINTFIIEGTAYFKDVGLQELTTYYYKVSIVSLSGIENNLDLLPATKAWTTLKYYNDWPVQSMGDARSTTGSPKTHDFNNDGDKELFFTTQKDKGYVFGFYNNCEEIYDIDYNPTMISGIAQFDDEIWGSSAIGDIDMDGIDEIVVATRQAERVLYVYKLVNDTLPVLMFNDTLNGPQLNSPVLSDINNDGYLEILVKSEYENHLQVYDYNGNLLTGTWDTTSQGIGGYSMPAVADIDGDQVDKEIIYGADTGLYIWNYDGSNYLTNPVFPTGRVSSPVIVDIDNDGDFEIVFVSATTNYDAYVYVMHHTGSLDANWNTASHYIQIYHNTYKGMTPPPAVGDIDNDSYIEIVVIGKDTVKIWNHDGTLMQAFKTESLTLNTTPILADVDEDDDIEIIFDGIDKIHGYNIDGSKIIGWPLKKKEGEAEPIVSDVDNDGLNEVVAASGDVLFYVWETKGDADKIEWGNYRSDNYNSGVYYNYCLYDTNYNITINTGENVEWYDVKKLKGNLIIEDSAKLTIKNIVSLTEDGEIIVKQGGELIVDGGTITNFCGDQWGGIQVWGNSDSSQYAPPGLSCAQGKLILKNGAVIENANIAVDLWKSGHYETSGGIVEAEDAVFRNNGLSIRAVPYENIHPYNPDVELDNFSYFKNCIFEGDIDNVFYQSHVFLWGVKGIDFSACDFSTVLNSGTPQWSSGIKAYNTGFMVLPECTNSTSPCTEYDSCSFTGFYSAIEAETDGSSTNTFLVHTAIFNNNTYGVKIDGVNNGSVLFSEFNIGRNSTLDTIGCINAPGVGIHLENATGFAFEENIFTKYHGAPVGNYIGISINNTESSDEVYKNYFSGLSYANYSNGQNWGKATSEGLCYFCNENTGNYTDFFVDSTGIKSGIQSSQGNDELVTGNTFSQDDPTWHFYNGGGHMVLYYYCDTCDNETPDDNKISNLDKNGLSFNNSCASHYGDEIPDDFLLDQQEKQNKEQEYSNALSSYNIVKTLYEGYIDGGSTTNELMDIQSAQPQDMWALRVQLLGDSPHLSMEVLKAASDKTDVFTEAALFDILASNPDELKKEELLKYLEEKQNPIPSYMIDILRSLAYGTTYKTTLQQQMGKHYRIKTRAAHDIIRSNLNDSISNNVELRNWLDNLSGLSSDRQIIASYVNRGEFNSAYTLANILPSLYGLQGNELAEHNYFMEILSLHDTLHKQGRNIAQLDSTEISNLMVIANNSTGIAGTYAKSILECNYGCHYVNCPSLNGSVAFKSRKVNLNSLRKVYGISISVKPNPARQWAAFDYTLSNDDSKGIITIRDISGKIIQELHVNGKQGQILWDTRQIKPGIYLYTLVSEGFSKSDKIVISE